MDKSSLEFGEIRSVYERNNRSTQMKALRCFPSCKPTGHTNVGFCGSSLKALLHVYIDDASPPCQKVDAFWTQVLYLAEIRCSDENGLSNRRYVLKSEIIPQIRCKSEKYRPYIKGECIEIRTSSSPDGSVMMKEITLEFNSDHNAWHYGWMSHRYTSDKTHVIDVMMLVQPKHDADCFFMAASFLSKPFTVVSTKRSRAERRAEGADDDIDRDASFPTTNSPVMSHPAPNVRPLSAPPLPTMSLPAPPPLPNTTTMKSEQEYRTIPVESSSSSVSVKMETTEESATENGTEAQPIEKRARLE